MTDKDKEVRVTETSNIMSKPKADTAFRIMLIITIVLQLAVALCFCVQKQGFHYDENYSYYSSNVTYGLNLVKRKLYFRGIPYYSGKGL